MSRPPFPEQPPPGHQPSPVPMQPYQPQPYGQPYPPQRPMPTASPKSGGVAVILSFLIPGLGHLYTGNPLSAVMWFGSTFVVWVLGFLTGVVFFVLPLVYIGAMIHAYISAANFNRRHRSPLARLILGGNHAPGIDRAPNRRARRASQLQ
jgi:TM2 domain-containing membrane protein YozV